MRLFVWALATFRQSASPTRFASLTPLFVSAVGFASPSSFGFARLFGPSVRLSVATVRFAPPLARFVCSFRLFVSAVRFSCPFRLPVSPVRFESLSVVPVRFRRQLRASAFIGSVSPAAPVRFACPLLVRPPRQSAVRFHCPRLLPASTFSVSSFRFGCPLRASISAARFGCPFRLSVSGARFAGH